MIDTEYHLGRSANHHFRPTLPIEMPGAGSRFFDPSQGAASPLGGACLEAVLDELDYGILVLVDGGCRVANVNHTAEMELDDDHPLLLSQARLEARLPGDRVPLRNAIDAAFGQGRRRLLTVGQDPRRTSVSIIPLRVAEGSPAAVLVILGKSAVCETLSISGFCNSHGLTLAENRVLTELCAGSSPKEIARQLGVSITTVRTQILSMRSKTGAPSIGALLARVAILPPLRGVLRPAGNRHASKSPASQSLA